MIYSGDIGSVDDYSDLLEGCDLLYTEGMHADLEKLFGLVAFNKVKKLILTHLSDKMYQEPEQILSLARKHGVGEVHLAEDGMKIKV
jgi:ribonuclease BN (tRNA processing enzyme)